VAIIIISVMPGFIAYVRQSLKNKTARAAEQTQVNE
jgi:hypothetical protein